MREQLIFLGLSKQVLYMHINHQFISVSTAKSFELIDITSLLKKCIIESKVENGVVSISSQHTTTALTVNEYESRLLDDIAAFFAQMVPQDAPYRHNDIHLRDCLPDEPKNAHSHLIAMMLGNSESVAVADKELILGTYQSVLLVELDGPRERRVSVQIMGE